MTDAMNGRAVFLSALMFGACGVSAMLGGCGPEGTRPAAAVVALAAATPNPATAPASAPLRSSFYGTPFEKHPDAATLTELGRALFSEVALSASAKMSCASCHDPAHAYGPPNNLSVQLGGADMKQPGIRAVPSLMYQQDAPPFSEHFNDTDGDDSVDQGPTGGRDWDGRASSVHEQAAGPLLSAYEMANTDEASVIDRLAGSASADRFKAAFGEHVFDDRHAAWNGLLLAFEVFQQSPADFYPYSSKYDDYLRRKVELSPAEKRGMLLFNDPAGANCAACHISGVKRGVFPQFTDHGLIAIGVPRNAALPANKDATWHDLGLCGPLRTDLKDNADYCGLFKTPSLRNVSVRGSFFHNGGFHKLEDVIRFYSERDVNPGKFYAKDRHGKVRKYDDLPARYQENVNVDAPFGRQPGERPVLTAGETGDMVAFLKTLTDGYRR